jgi:hypothetical protein
VNEFFTQSLSDSYTDLILLSQTKSGEPEKGVAQDFVTREGMTGLSIQSWFKRKGRGPKFYGERKERVIVL